jgi:hypothetical protein
MTISSQLDAAKLGLASEKSSERIIAIALLAQVADAAEAADMIDDRVALSTLETLRTAMILELARVDVRASKLKGVDR